MTYEPIEPIEMVNQTDRPIIIPPGVPVSPVSKWADIKDGLFAELDGISDPFIQMVYIMMVLMPEMTSEVKEHDLRSLAYSQDALRIYNETMDRAQESFNDISQSDHPTVPENSESAEKIYYELRYLEEYLALDEALDPAASEALREDVQELLYSWFEASYANYDWRAIGANLHKIMDGDSSIYNGYSPNEMRELNPWVNLFHTAGVTFGAQSKALQGLMEFDVEDYNAYITMFQTMFEKFVEQNNASIKKLTV